MPSTGMFICPEISAELQQSVSADKTKGLVMATRRLNITTPMKFMAKPLAGKRQRQVQCAKTVGNSSVSSLANVLYGLMPSVERVDNWKKSCTPSSLHTPVAG